MAEKYFKIDLLISIVSSYVAHNAVRIDHLSALIDSVNEAFEVIDPPPPEIPIPKVAIAKSVTSHHIICLEDGRKFQAIKRHLMSAHGMTPNQYRARWDLPTSYPMTASAFSDRRSKQATGTSFGTRMANTNRRGQPRQSV
jgi:predicted transcriptional regulator